MDLVKEVECLRLENQLQKAQLSQYQEDFKHERDDRTRAAEAKLRIEEEFKEYKEANTLQLTKLDKKMEEILLQLIEKDETIKSLKSDKEKLKEELQVASEENEKLTKENSALKTKITSQDKQEKLLVALEENQKLTKENSALKTKITSQDKQLQAYKENYNSVKRGFKSLESNSNETEEILQEAVRRFQVRADAATAELEAAREEIAVKVAQVKQYQKQVEAYKQRLEQCQLSVKPECQIPKTLQSAETRHSEYKESGASEQLCLEHNDPGEGGRGAEGGEGRGGGGGAEGGERGREVLSAFDSSKVLNQSLTAAQTQTAAPKCVHDGDDQEDEDSDDDDLPPPIFLQQICHPIASVANIPLSQLDAQRVSGLSNGMAHRNGVFPSSEAQVSSSADRMGGDMSQAAGFQNHIDSRGFEDTNTPTPLDPNLKCPICGRFFKKGRIQKYKRHVLSCETRSNCTRR